MKKYAVELYSRTSIGGTGFPFLDEFNEELANLFSRIIGDEDEYEIVIITEDELRKIVEEFEKIEDKEGWTWNEKSLCFGKRYIYEGASCGYSSICFIEIDDSNYYEAVAEKLFNFLVENLRENKEIELEEKAVGIDDAIYSLRKNYANEDDFLNKEKIFKNIEDFKDDIYDLVATIADNNYSDYAIIVTCGGAVSTSMDPYDNQKIGWTYFMSKDEFEIYWYWYQGSWEFRDYVRFIVHE